MPEKQTILVVEDDSAWQSVLRDTLKDEGYSVVTVGNYQDSRQALEKRAFDLVLLDLELEPSAPMLDGERLLNLITRHYSGTPCVVVSGKGTPSIVRDAFKRYNVVDYVSKKHFDIPNFIKTVQTALAANVPQATPGSGNGMDAPDADLGSEQDLQAIPDYEQILRIIQNMGEVMERSPHAFVNMGEEDLRHHFLVQLNGQFQGRATGETFNFNGKTDILIRINGKNIFIAECKFWKGPKGLRDTIDQLLGYANWRDTKTAILLFNRNRNFSDVLTSVPGVAEGHPCFRRRNGVQEETIFRYVFQRPDDSKRELVLTIMAFDIPTRRT